MYIEYKCPPRAPIANLVSVIHRDVKPWADRHNVPFQVVGNSDTSSIRVEFERETHITLFLLSFTPRKYTTSWRRVIDVHRV